MMQERTWKLCGLLLLAACLTATAAFAGDDKGEDKDVEVIVDKEVKVIVKKLADCEGDDCEGERRMIFIGEDGEHHEIEGGHGDHVWVAHGGGHGHHGQKGGFLGVQMTELTPELRVHFGVPDDAGVMVSKVVDDSPASRAGVEVGDVVSAVDGEAVGSGNALARAIRGHEDGEAVQLEIWRGGQVQTLTANLEEREGMRHERNLRVHRHDFSGHDFDCGGEGKCEVHVECDGGGECDCTVNGEAMDCDELHAAHGDDD